MKLNEYTIEINVDYDEGLERRYLLIKTIEDKITVGANLQRAEIVMNTRIFWDGFDSYEEYYGYYCSSNFDIVTKEEFDTMERCFDGYNENTFESYLREKYGYETKLLRECCDFKVTIN